MQSMHPHWQSTGAPQKNAAVPTADTITKPNDWKPASRRPAALVGIGLVVTILFAFVQGVEYLQGQLLSEVKITVQEDNTIEPQSVSVDRGSIIVFMNNSPSLMVIGSDTLCSDEIDCMYIPIFPFSSERYRVPVSANVQAHSFYRETPNNVLGEIIITNNVPQELQESVEAPIPTPINEPVQEVAPPIVPDTVIPETTQEVDDSEFQETTSQPRPTHNKPSPPEEPEEEPLPLFEEENLPPTNEQTGTPSTLTAELPRNPYTVGSNLALAPLPVGGPTPTEFHGGAPLPPIQQHRPIRQPATGMGTWIGITIAFMGGAILLRHSRRTMLITEARR